MDADPFFDFLFGEEKNINYLENYFSQFLLNYFCRMDFPIHSPVQEVQSSLMRRKKLSLWIKRDDLIHKEISGNKFRKLKYNLQQAGREGKKTILTFGGAYSNHIAATAYAGKLFGFSTIGIIRGEEGNELNPTLKQARENGMRLKFISRLQYSRKDEEFFLDRLKAEFGDVFCVPEGGANAHAVKGCSEILDGLEHQFDIVCVACGTGTTLAGIVSALGSDQKALGFSALKGGGFLKFEVGKFLAEMIPNSKMQLITDYHFGGYAKINDELLEFAAKFFHETRIPLDLVYTAKLFYGIYDLAEKDYFPQDSRILAVHTGGLQGNEGMKQRYGLEVDFC